MSADREVHDVAIVVFARTRGYDAADAADAAALAIRHALSNEVFGALPVDVPFAERVVRIIGVKDVGVAAWNGYLHIQPTSRASYELGGRVTDEGL